MKNIFLGLIIAFSTVACSTMNPSDGSFGDNFTRGVYEHAVLRTVKVEIYDQNRQIGHCSGVLVEDNTIATAAHCLESPYTGEVRQASDLKINFAYTDQTIDVQHILAKGEPGSSTDYALLYAELPNPYAKHDAHHAPRCDYPPVGTQIFHVGNPGEADLAVTFGHISSYRTHDPSFGPWKGTVLADITGAPGSSGGPVFDMRGRLVGLIVAGGRSGLTYYVPTQQFVTCGKYGAV